MRKRRTALIVVAVVVVLAGALVAALLTTRGRPIAGQGSGPSSSGPLNTSGTPMPSGSVKPIIRGLVDRQGAPAKSMLPLVHAYVVKVNWADLQPQQGGPIVAGNAIDQAISRARQSDYAGVGMALKLRVFAGINAPAWAKALGGSAFAYVDNQDGASVSGGTLGRFWTPAFESAYADLQAKLAAKYDDVPEVREITVSGCTTIFDEPFVRQPGDKNNTTNLLQAGYSEEANKSCISSAIAAHAVWQHTTSDLDFSPLPSVTEPDAPNDVDYPITVMSECRKVLGVRCGLQNNALSTSKLADPTFQKMYAAMVELGTPVVFQTAAKSRIGNPQQTLEAAVTMKANSIELPQGYPSWSRGILTAAAAGLAANPAG